MNASEAWRSVGVWTFLILAWGFAGCAATVRGGVLSTVDGRGDAGIEMAGTLGAGVGDETGGVLMTMSASAGPMLGADVDTPFTGSMLLGIEADYFGDRDDFMGLLGLQAGARVRSEMGGLFGGIVGVGYKVFDEVFVTAVLLASYSSVTDFELGGGLMLALGGGFGAPW